LLLPAERSGASYTAGAHRGCRTACHPAASGAQEYVGCSWPVAGGRCHHAAPRLVSLHGNARLPGGQGGGVSQRSGA
jgi:hypothetical protein